MHTKFEFKVIETDGPVYALGTINIVESPESAAQCTAWLERGGEEALLLKAPPVRTAMDALHAIQACLADTWLDDTASRRAGVHFDTLIATVSSFPYDLLVRRTNRGRDLDVSWGSAAVSEQVQLAAILQSSETESAWRTFERAASILQMLARLLDATTPYRRPDVRRSSVLLLWK